MQLQLLLLSEAETVSQMKTLHKHNMISAKKWRCLPESPIATGINVMYEATGTWWRAKHDMCITGRWPGASTEIVLCKIVLSSMEAYNGAFTNGRQPTGWDTQTPCTSKEDMIIDACHRHSPTRHKISKLENQYTWKGAVIVANKQDLRVQFNQWRQVDFVAWTCHNCLWRRQCWHRWWFLSLAPWWCWRRIDQQDMCQPIFPSHHI